MEVGDLVVTTTSTGTLDTASNVTSRTIPEGAYGEVLEVDNNEAHVDFENFGAHWVSKGAIQVVEHSDYPQELLNPGDSEHAQKIKDFGLSEHHQPNEKLNESHLDPVPGVPMVSPHEVFESKDLGDHILDLFEEYKKSGDPELLATIKKYSKHIGVSMNQLDRRCARRVTAKIKAPFCKIPQRKSQHDPTPNFPSAAPTQPPAWQKHIRSLSIPWKKEYTDVSSIPAPDGSGFCEEIDFTVEGPVVKTPAGKIFQLHELSGDLFASPADPRTYNAQRKAQGRQGQSDSFDSWFKQAQHDEQLYTKYEQSGSKLSWKEWAKQHFEKREGQRKAGWENGYWKGPMKDGYPAHSKYFDDPKTGEGFHYPWQKDLPPVKNQVDETKCSSCGLPYSERGGHFGNHVCNTCAKGKGADRQGQKIEYKLKRKPETEEWMVAAYVDGKFNDDKTYYTDDKEDAEATLKEMQKREGQSDEESKYNFKNGDRVRLKGDYAQGEKPNETFILSQWDGNRGWIGDKQGRGWYVRGYQIELARGKKGQSGAMSPPAQNQYSSTGSAATTSTSYNPGTAKVVPPKPTSPPPAGYKYVLDGDSNLWVIAPINSLTQS